MSIAMILTIIVIVIIIQTALAAWRGTGHFQAQHHGATQQDEDNQGGGQQSKMNGNFLPERSSVTTATSVATGRDK